MKKMIVMRGLPGSGKSTEVTKIIANFCNSHLGYSTVVCSADHFFLDSNGEYHFNPKMIGDAHAACKEKAQKFMNAGVDLVIIDNTNTQYWEYQPYLTMAETYNYEVEIVKVGGILPENVELYAQRNTHGVPKEAIKRMAERFQD